MRNNLAAPFFALLLILLISGCNSLSGTDANSKEEVDWYKSLSRQDQIYIDQVKTALLSAPEGTLIQMKDGELFVIRRSRSYITAWDAEHRDGLELLYDDGVTKSLPFRGERWGLAGNHLCFEVVLPVVRPGDQGYESLSAQFLSSGKWK